MDDPKPTRPLLKPADVMALLNISRKTLYRKSRSGEIPCVRVGTQYRYRPEDIEAIIEDREPMLPEGGEEEDDDQE